jgi:hypothetical protein
VGTRPPELPQPIRTWQWPPAEVEPSCHTLGIRRGTCVVLSACPMARNPRCPAAKLTAMVSADGQLLSSDARGRATTVCPKPKSSELQYQTGCSQSGLPVQRQLPPEPALRGSPRRPAAVLRNRPVNVVESMQLPDPTRAAGQRQLPLVANSPYRPICQSRCSEFDVRKRSLQVPTKPTNAVGGQSRVGEDVLQTNATGSSRSCRRWGSA